MTKLILSNHVRIADICGLMKLKEKYKALQNKNLRKEKVIASVYSTMMLENQGVSEKRIRELYDEVKTTSKLSTVH